MPSILEALLGAGGPQAGTPAVQPPLLPGAGAPSPTTPLTGAAPPVIPPTAPVVPGAAPTPTPTTPGLLDQFGAFLQRPGIQEAGLGAGLGLLSGQTGFEAFSNAMNIFQTVQDRAAAGEAAKFKRGLEVREQARKEKATAAEAGLKGEQAISEASKRAKIGAEIIEIGATTRKKLAETDKVAADVAETFFTFTAEQGEPVTEQDFSDFTDVFQATGSLAPIRQIVTVAEDAVTRIAAGQGTAEEFINLAVPQLAAISPESEAAVRRLLSKYINAGVAKVTQAQKRGEEEGGVGQAITDFFVNLSTSLGDTPETQAVDPSKAIPSLPTTFDFSRLPF